MRHPQINLTLSVLEHMLRTDAFVAEFPFLKAAKHNWHSNAIAQTGGCRKCGRRPGIATQGKTLDMVRSAIVGLPAPKMDRLKELLNADKLVIYFFLNGKQVRREI